MVMFIRVTPDDRDALLCFIEDGIRDAHEMTCEAENAKERDEAWAYVQAGLRLLREIDPEHLLLDARIRSGIPLDWDALMDEIADDEEDDEQVPTADTAETAQPS